MPRVRAKSLGFYGGSRRRIGAVFSISNKKNEKGEYAELGNWMVIVDDDTPTSAGGGKQGGPQVIPAKPEAASTKVVTAPKKGAPTSSADVDEEKAATITAAVGRLDHSMDTHWKKDGTADLRALTEFAGQRITREELDAVFPGLVRRS